MTGKKKDESEFKRAYNERTCGGIYKTHAQPCTETIEQQRDPLKSAIKIKNRRTRLYKNIIDLYKYILYINEGCYLRGVENAINSKLLKRTLIL